MPVLNKAVQGLVVHMNWQDVEKELSCPFSTRLVAK